MTEAAFPGRSGGPHSPWHRSPSRWAPAMRHRGRGSAPRVLRDGVQLEGASVDAFERLERDLEDHGAPSDLRMRARRSARDEVRHTKTTAKRASLFGARLARGPVALPSKDDAHVLSKRSQSRTRPKAARARPSARSYAWAGRTRGRREHPSRDEDDRARRVTSRRAFVVALEWSLGELGGDARARVQRAMHRALAGMRSAPEAATIAAAFQRTMPSLRNPSSTSA